ncbi:MAG: zinc ribbon domain-containing protein [Candidatus Delongbacteria bacterium]|nr:zinc ribbon domain-containing protein [Candidatus Delongbacteria bacterium]
MGVKDTRNDEKLSIKDFDNFCPKCIHFQQMGVCSIIHTNVRDYPKMFVKKCNGKFFEENKNLTFTINANQSNEEPTINTEIRTKTCPYCNGIIPLDANKCGKCGKMLLYSGSTNSKVIKKQELITISIIIFLLILIGILSNNPFVTVFGFFYSACFYFAIKLISAYKKYLRKKNSVLSKPIGKYVVISLLLFAILFTISLGFFHIVPHEAGITIFPKAHFTYYYTFVDVSEIVEKYNNRNLGQMLRGDEVFDNLHDRLFEKGIIVKSGKTRSIDWSL